MKSSLALRTKPREPFVNVTSVVDLPGPGGPGRCSSPTLRILSLTTLLPWPGAGFHRRHLDIGRARTPRDPRSRGARLSAYVCDHLLDGGRWQAVTTACRLAGLGPGASEEAPGPPAGHTSAS